VKCVAGGNLAFRFYLRRFALDDQLGGRHSAKSRTRSPRRCCVKIVSVDKPKHLNAAFPLTLAGVQVRTAGSRCRGLTRRDQPDGLLLENEGKPVRERLTLIRNSRVTLPRLWGQLRCGSPLREGVACQERRRNSGSLSTAELCAGRGLAVRLVARGRADQRVTVTVFVKHVRLCYSRMLFVRAHPGETQEMVFGAPNLTLGCRCSPRHFRRRY
jgi:hypothetical protein